MKVKNFLAIIYRCFQGFCGFNSKNPINKNWKNATQWKVQKENGKSTLNNWKSRKFAKWKNRTKKNAFKNNESNDICRFFHFPSPQVLIETLMRFNTFRMNGFDSFKLISWVIILSKPKSRLLLDFFFLVFLLRVFWGFIFRVNQGRGKKKTLHVLD